MSTLLTVEELSAGYGDVEIVHELSMHVDAAEIVTIIGPNGAGKSTLLKAIFGSLPLFRGRVHFRGEDVTDYSAPRMVAAGASFVPQSDNVFPSLSIRENLEIGGYLRREGRAERVVQVLSLFAELERRPGEKASRLSGGQRQTLAIGRAMMLDPVLLLLDEPTASLSPIMRQEVFERVLAIREGGVAVLMVEQNAKEALAISDRGYVLVAGRCALEQRAADLLANPQVGRLFLGQDGGAAGEPAAADLQA